MASLGTIESTNGAALMLFGYHKNELVGQSISVIVPHPMGAAHQGYLERYMATGHTVRSPEWLLLNALRTHGQMRGLFHTS